VELTIISLHEDRVGGVDHYLGDLAVIEEALDRPVSEYVLTDFFGDALPFGGTQRDVGFGDQPFQFLDHRGLELSLSQSAAKCLGLQLAVQGLLGHALEFG